MSGKKLLEEFLEIFAKAYQFTNINNSQMFLVVVAQKFILNFKINLFDPLFISVTPRF